MTRKPIFKSDPSNGLKRDQRNSKIIFWVFLFPALF